MRLDVTVRDMKEIEEISASLSEHRVRRIDITHVTKAVQPVHVAQALTERLPNLDVAIYFSAKHFRKGSNEDARTAFRRTVSDALGNGFKKFLIVSGYPRDTFDTIEALQLLQGRQLPPDCDIACAYNPYFDPARLREENERLERKLAHPFVSSVYLQIGMDIEKLQKGVSHIRSIRPDVRLLGCVPVPSEATLNRLKLIALYGVFLPNSYLLSVESAKDMTKQLLKAFRSQRIEPVVFAPHMQDLKEALSLFA